MLRNSVACELWSGWEVNERAFWIRGEFFHQWSQSEAILKGQQDEKVKLKNPPISGGGVKSFLIFRTHNFSVTTEDFSFFTFNLIFLQERGLLLEKQLFRGPVNTLNRWGFSMSPLRVFSGNRRNDFKDEKDAAKEINWVNETVSREFPPWINHVKAENFLFNNIKTLYLLSVRKSFSLCCTWKIKLKL